LHGEPGSSGNGPLVHGAAGNYKNAKAKKVAPQEEGAVANRFFYAG
jgi:hypothetical protein